MRGIWIAGAVVALAGVAQADDWGTNADLAVNGGAIDMSSIRRSGDTVVFWVINHKPNALVLGKPVDYYMNRWRLDCVQQTFQILATTAYGASGSTVVASETIPTSVSNIMPDSYGAYIAGVVCDGPPKDWTVNSLDATVSFVKTMVNANRNSSSPGK